MGECVFCKIVDGEIPCHKVWEDENFLAFVDVFPVLKDQILLIPKKHVVPSVFDIENNLYHDLMLRTKELAKKMNSSLKPIKVGMMVEGLELDHVHVKLFPFYNREGFGLKTLDSKPSEKEFKELAEKISKEC